MSLCKYSTIFGKPNEGSHKTHMFGVAVFDTVGTMFLALIGAWISKYYKCKLTFTQLFFAWFLILFILSIILHRLFCVRSAVDRLLFPNA